MKTMLELLAQLSPEEREELKDRQMMNEAKASAEIALNKYHSVKANKKIKFGKDYYFGHKEGLIKLVKKVKTKSLKPTKWSMDYDEVASQLELDGEQMDEMRAFIRSILKQDRQSILKRLEGLPRLSDKMVSVGKGKWLVSLSDVLDIVGNAAISKVEEMVGEK